MRAKQCVMCGAPLPPGGRVHRQYCREACRALAFRRRHKQEAAEDDRAQAAERAALAACPAPTQVSLADRVAQAEAELATVKHRLAELEAQYRTLVRHVASLEPQKETEQPLSAAQHTVSPPARLDAETVAPPPSFAQDDSPGGRQTPAEPISAVHVDTLPWLMPSPDDPAKLVPKWIFLDANYLSALDEMIDRHLPLLPAMLAQVDGLAKPLPSWTSSEFSVIRQLAHALGRRIVCTDLSQRESDAQQQVLGALALRDLISSLKCEEQSEKKELERYLSINLELMAYVALFLILKLRNVEGVPESKAPAQVFEKIAEAMREIDRRFRKRQ